MKRVNFSIFNQVKKNATPNALSAKTLFLIIPTNKSQSGFCRRLQESFKVTNRLKY